MRSGSFLRLSRKKGGGPGAPVPSTPSRRPIVASKSSPRGVADVGDILDDLGGGSHGDGGAHDHARRPSFSERSASVESGSSAGRSNGDDTSEFYTDDTSYDDSAAYLDGATTDRDDSSGASSEESTGGGGESGTMNELCYRLGVDDKKLSEVLLECDTIGRGTAKDIAELLPANTNLRRLCVAFGPSDQEGQAQHRQRHHLRNDNFRVLLSGLSKNSSIVDFELRNAYLTRDVATRLGAALAQNRSVHKICLRDCELVGSGLAVLFLGLQHNRGSIRDLAILSCDLAGGSNSDILAASIPLMKLKSLALSETNLTMDGLRFLFENIVRSPDLEALDLSRNELGTEGTILLCDSLRSWRHQVTKLVLSYCSLDDYCIGELAKGLAKCPNLAILHLSHNEIGDRGASHLCKLLGRNNSIGEMRLHGCNIGRKLRRAIADGLRYNSSILKSLGFSATTSLAILDTVNSIEKLRSSVSGEVSAQARY